MKKQITLQNRTVNYPSNSEGSRRGFTLFAYTLRKSRRARRMRIAVYCDGSVVVTTPFNIKESVAERFVREKTNWLFSKIAYFKQFKGKLVARHNYDHYLKYKTRAYDLVLERVKHFNNIYGYKFNKINIKNQKTRWGSCSKKGNLNFNYKILFLPSKIQDYIVMHELCHLKEFNHSRKFWNLVAKILPNHQEIKGDLRKYSISL
jgi:predicted metal-dependent hydrolase